MPNESDPRRRQPGPAYPGPALPGPAQPGPTQPGRDQPGPTQPGPTQPGPTQPGNSPSAEEAGERARALLLPVPDSQPGVGPVPPGKPDPVRPTTRAATAVPEHGIICWNCGVDNRDDRVFCRNCGVEVHRRPVVAAPAGPSWWQRFRDRLNDLNLFAVTLALLAAAVLIAAGFLARPLFYAVQERFSTPIAIAPAAVDASNSDPAHPPAAAFDHAANTWWGPGYSGNSTGQWLRAVLNPPSDLRAVRITPEVSAQPSQREAQARPHHVDLVVFDQRGHRTTKPVTLTDHRPKLVYLHVSKAAQVLVVLRDGYGTSADKEIAIAELELFRY